MTLIGKSLAAFAPALIGLFIGAITPTRAAADGVGQLGKLVVVGDSLAAGFQSFSLYDSDFPSMMPPGGQKHGFANLIAQQTGASLQLPLISYPGFPPVLTLNGQTVERTFIPGLREPQTLPVQTLDLSVPGFTVADSLAYVIKAGLSTHNPEDLLALNVMGYPALLNPAQACGIAPYGNGGLIISEVACAVQLRPNTVIVDIGNNDVLQAVTTGVAPTRVSDFSASYQRVVAALSATGARLVLGNIPDVTSVPYLLSVEQFEHSCLMIPAGAAPGDYLVLAFDNPNQSSFNICTNYVVRPAALIAQARAAVKQYNDVIEHAAARYRAVLVDVNSVYAQIAKNGYDVPGRHLTAQYLGGIFSLDGIHPTNTGYAIMANAYIAAIDRQLHTDIQPVSVAAVAATDPLIF